MNNLTLITGGVRSGKSLFAEKLAESASCPVIYIATMPIIPSDPEQQARIDRHRARRPSNWRTIEAPYNLVQVIEGLPNAPVFCLIDCLSLWASNILLGDNPEQAPENPWQHESKLFAAAEQLVEIMERKIDIHFAVVTNEVGWGVVPENSLARAYRDLLGLLNQHFAHSANTVYLTAAGIPIKLKPQSGC